MTASTAFILIGLACLVAADIRERHKRQPAKQDKRQWVDWLVARAAAENRARRMRERAEWN